MNESKITDKAKKVLCGGYNGSDDLMQSVVNQWQALAEDSGAVVDCTQVGVVNRINRIRLKMTMHEHAKAIGITSAQMSMYETGKLPLPDDVEAAMSGYWESRKDEIAKSCCFINVSKAIT